MNKYTFYVEGLGREVSIVSSSEKLAYKELIKTFTDEESDRIVSIDWIDTEAA